VTTDPPLKAKLASGRPLIGLWSVVANATLVEIGARAGLDFHVLDMEHGAYDFGSLEQAIRAAECGGGAPLVRVPDLTPSTFQRVLDLGAHGLVVPQIRSAADAERAVQFATYAPRGQRGYNPFTRVADYSAPPTSDYGKMRPGFLTLCVIIENQAAFDDLEAICALPEIDVVYLGVYDMSLALDCGGDVTHPKVQRFVVDASHVISAAGKAVGVMARSPEAAAAAVANGARFIVGGVDSNTAYQAFQSMAGWTATGL
jgi:2-keto-3-deoxy-L-rhamnonate aldolase RhmA